MLRGVSLLTFEDATLDLGLAGWFGINKRKKEKNSRNMVRMDKGAQGLGPEREREMSESSHRD